LKLREAGAGVVLTLATPWHAEDLYSVLLKRAAESEAMGDNAIKVRIDPAWKLKEGVNKNKPLRELEEKDVILLFPERLTFKFLRRELLNNEAFFMSQNLIQWPKDANADEKFTFDLDLIQQRVRPAGFFSDARVLRTCLILDQAFSTSGLADFSALVTMKIMQRPGGTEFALVCDLVMERMRQDDIALNVVQAYIKHHHSDILIERVGAFESLQRDIAKNAIRRGVSLPQIYWKQPVSSGISPKSKIMRIKNLAVPLADGRLWFTASGWLDAILEQFTRFNGNKSTGSKKDDALDALSRGIEAYLPRHLGDLTLLKSDEQLAEEKATVERERLQAWTRHVFGETAGAPRPRPAEPGPEYSNPLFRGAGEHLRRKP
jgi:hypothetical protein